MITIIIIHPFEEPRLQPQLSGLKDCVALVLLRQENKVANRNEEAEDIMERVEKQEAVSTRRKNNDDGNVADKSFPSEMHHSCIVNLVIGTLYCKKGNFEFGISRICKSL